METIFSVLHVLTAVFLVGPMAILPHVAMRDLRAGNAAQAATLGRSVNVFSLASLLVIVFGFGLLGVSESEEFDLSVTTPWILASLIVYIVALALTLTVIVPALRGAGAATDRGGLYKRVAMSSGIVTLLLLAAVVLMVWKP